MRGKQGLLYLIIVPYMITAIWFLSPVAMWFANDYITKFFFGIVFIVGFVVFVTRGKELKNFKLSPTGGVEFTTIHKIRGRK